MQTANFHRRIQHSFLQQKQFYDEQCAPLLRSLHPNTVNWMLGLKLGSLVRNNEGTIYETMRSAIDGHSLRYQKVLAMRSSQTGNPPAPSEPASSKASTRKGLKKDVKAEKKKSKICAAPSGQNLDLDINPLSQVVGDDPQQLIEGLKWLSNAERRFNFTRHQDFMHQNYKFNVGDVVYQRELGQLGVVADRLPTCFEGDEWIREQLSSTDDLRLKFPWYFILVASHNDLPVDMTRYGSELTHIRLERKMSIGFHSLLPVYFEGYDAAKGVYIPRKDNRVFSKNFSLQLAKSQQISISSIMSRNISTRKAEEQS